MDRNGLINDLRGADEAKRAYVVLNSHQVRRTAHGCRPAPACC